MAFETELGNLVHLTDAISSVIAPEFKEKTFMLGLVVSDTFDPSSNVLKFTRSGSLTAKVVAESSAYTYDSGSELTDTAVSVTAQKVMVGTKITPEARRFGAPFNSLDRIASAQAAALARKFDDDVLALAAGFSNSVVSTSTFTADDLLKGLYTLQLNNSPLNIAPAAILSSKQVYELQLDISGNSGSVWSNDALVDVLVNAGSRGAFAGSVAGIDIYRSNLIDQDGGTPNRFEGLLIDREWAICAGIGGAAETDAFMDPDDKILKVVTHYFYGVAEFNDAAGVLMKSDV